MSLVFEFTYVECFGILARVSDTSIDDNDNVRSAHMLDTPSGNDVLDTSTDDGGNRLVELDLKLTPGQWRVIKDRYRK